MSSHTLPVSSWPVLQDFWLFPGELEKHFSFYIFHGRKMGETDIGTATLVLSDRSFVQYCSLKKAHEYTVRWAMVIHPLRGKLSYRDVLLKRY